MYVAIHEVDVEVASCLPESLLVAAVNAPKGVRDKLGLVQTILTYRAPSLWSMFPHPDSGKLCL